MFNSLYDPVIHFVCEYSEEAVVFEVHLFSLLSNLLNPALNTPNLLAYKVI